MLTIPKVIMKEELNNVDINIALYKDNSLELVRIKGEENTIDYIISIYKDYNYSLPKEYCNPLTFKEFTYLIDDKKIYINIFNLINEKDINYFVKALKVTLKPFNIHDIIVYCKGNIVTFNN